MVRLELSKSATNQSKGTSMAIPVKATKTQGYLSLQDIMRVGHVNRNTAKNWRRANLLPEPDRKESNWHGWKAETILPTIAALRLIHEIREAPINRIEKLALLLAEESSDQSLQKSRIEEILPISCTPIIPRKAA
jgi:hypothetical protein